MRVLVLINVQICRYADMQMWKKENVRIADVEIKVF